jgi:putative ABC transport system substrate-binding protein
MRRRELITILGGAAVAPALLWPLAARGQQPGKLPTIGFLGALAPEREQQNTAAFLRRLGELGWIEGRNVAIEYRWAEGSAERTAVLAAEFVRLKVDVIHVSGNLSALVAKRTTSVIPIVFALAGDPVGTGLVASLARPGGNVTGLSNQLTDAAGKRLELLRDAVPDLRRFAIMASVGSLSVLETGEVQAAARSLGLDAITLEIRRSEDIALAFDGLKGRADALYVANSVFLAVNGMQITTLALAARLPTMFADRGWVEMGGLMSFGANIRDRFRRSADLVDKILRGAKPADIPVEQPTKFELVINLKTARALGLTLPQTLLATADEVIE